MLHPSAGFEVFQCLKALLKYAMMHQKDRKRECTMTSPMLSRARAYETEKRQTISDEERPAFHLTGAVGWINDPNGFSHYGGEYHLFYQSNPYDTHWGSIHWGHAKSRDMLRWEYLPASLAPDMPYDGAGCFSGSAVALPDGRHLLMYTGVEHITRPDGTPANLQAQCIAFGDGLNYEKDARNPVITAADLPAGALDTDFRDPKIWQEPDGSFRVVLASDRGDGTGQILLYRSGDARKWELVSVLDQSDGKLGGMWECPDFFPLEGRHILITSPMNMEPQGLEFHPGHNVMALIGSFDGRNFHREQVQNVDCGLDFYAPQTMLAPDGRRILIGWMQNWATASFVPAGAKYFGQLTLPRELSLQNGRLCQQPVRELERYRKNRTAYQGVTLGEETALEGIRGSMIDLTLTLHPEADCTSIQIALRKGGCHETTVTYLPKEQLLRLDRSRSGYRVHIVHTRDIPVQPENGALELRLILDRFSLELFVGHGEQAASAALFTPPEEDGIVFRSQGSARMDIEKFDLTV